MHPFSTPWKYQKIVRFSDFFQGVQKGCTGNKWVNTDSKQVIAELNKKGNSMRKHFSGDASLHNLNLKLNGPYLVCSGVVVLPK